MPKKNFTPIKVARASDGLIYFIDASGAAKRFTVKEVAPRGGLRPRNWG
jgi:hypothetical protein